MQASISKISIWEVPLKAFKIFVADGGHQAGAVRMDYRGEVSIDLKADTSWSPGSDILHNSRITLNLGEVKPTGDMHQKSYIVTIEELPGPNAGEHQREYYQRVIQDREEQELRNAGVSNDMIRRLKNVS